MTNYETHPSEVEIVDVLALRVGVGLVPLHGRLEAVAVVVAVVRVVDGVVVVGEAAGEEDAGGGGEDRAGKREPQGLSIS